MNRFPDNSRVVFLGDSIIANGKCIADIFDYYVNKCPQSKINFYNCGISGGSAYGALKYLDADVMAFKPTHVVIMLGINDFGIVSYSSNPDETLIKKRAENIQNYKVNMVALCEKLLSKNIKLMFCTPSPYDAMMNSDIAPYPDAPYGLAECADIVRGLSTLYTSIGAVDFFSIMSVMMRSVTLHNQDRVHPNDIGHAVMARAFLKAQGFDIDVIPEEIPVSKQHGVCRKTTETLLRSIWAVEWILLNTQWEKSDDDKIEYVKKYHKDHMNSNSDSFKSVLSNYINYKKSQMEIIRLIEIQTNNMYSDDIVRGLLPELLLFKSGSHVKTPTDWAKRRQEILDTAIELEYGGMPPEPKIFKVEPIHTPGAGKLNSFRINTGTKSAPFTYVLQIYRPENDGKSPVILTGDGCYTYCNDSVISEANRRGIAVAKFNRCEFAPDMYNTKRETGIYLCYPDKHFSAISAWAWGYHRSVDALLTMDFIDTDQIAITGHSRGGKTVLLAGATDERIAYTNPNNSGAHGCGCYRYEQNAPENPDFYDQRSEKLADLVNAVPYWMGSDMKNYIDREAELPHDMHYIKALIAPRYFLETEALDDIWSNPKGSYQTFAATKEVYKIFKAESNAASWYRQGGHNHGIDDFTALMDFMDSKRFNLSLPSNFTSNPYPEMTLI